MTKTGIEAVRTQILKSLISEAPFPGWTEEALRHAALKAGHGEGMALAVFPGGLKEAASAFSEFVDREMLRSLAAVPVQDLPVRERIRQAILARFDILENYREAERAALSYWAVPFRKISAIRLVWSTADRIWNWAGDISEDYNHYTKRLLLSGVLTATLLAWLDGRENIKPFLDRRIENVMQLNKALAPLKKKA